MLVAYASMTGNVERFVYKLDFPLFNILIRKGTTAVYEPFGTRNIHNRIWTSSKGK